MNSEQEKEKKTIEWYKAQAEELADIRRGLFPLISQNNDDEYYPDRVTREFKKLKMALKEIILTKAIMCDGNNQGDCACDLHIKIAEEVLEE